MAMEALRAAAKALVEVGWNWKLPPMRMEVVVGEAPESPLKEAAGVTVRSPVMLKMPAVVR
jgi:hypothetical protein